jgi:hypothetical protein
MYERPVVILKTVHFVHTVYVFISNYSRNKQLFSPLNSINHLISVCVCVCARARLSLSPRLLPLSASESLAFI